MNRGNRVAGGRSRTVFAVMVFVLLTALALAGSSRAASVFDTGFGKQGRVLANIRTDQVPRDGHVLSVDVFADGKILVAVQTDPEYTGLKVIRFNRNGSLDRSFAQEGILELADTWLVEPLAGGRFLTGGTVGSGTPGQDLAVRRYLSDGRLDRAFGSKGLYRRDLGAEDSPREMVVTSDARIVLSAQSFCHATERICYDSTSDNTWLLSLSERGKKLKSVRISQPGTVSGLKPAGNGTLRAWAVQDTEGGATPVDYVRVDRNLKRIVIRKFEEQPEFGPSVLLPGGESFRLATTVSEGDATFRVEKLSPKLENDSSFPDTGSCTAPAFEGTYGEQSIQLDSEGRIIAQTPHRNCFLFRVLPTGGLDPSFGDGGIVRLSEPEMYDVWAISSAPEGRTVMARWNGRPGQLELRRLNDDGRPDQDFSRDGQTSLVLKQATTDSVAAAVATPDGGALFAGSAECEGFSQESFGCRRFALTKRGADGKPDENFGSHGKVTANFMSVSALALTGDGSIVLGGTDGPARTHQFGFRPGFAVAKYRPGGTIDSSFGENGLVSTRIATAPESKDTARVLAVAVQTDGKIVATGEIGSGRRNGAEPIPVVRYNPDGSLDTSFAEGGIARIDLTEIERGRAIDVLPDGRILIAGRDRHDAIVLRLTPEGALDPAFGTGGIARPAIEDHPRYPDKPSRYTEEHEATSIAVLPGGGILAGTANAYGGQDGSVFKLKPNGRLDHGFGKRGVAYTGGIGINTLSVDRCRRVTVAGPYRRYSNTKRSFAVARLLPDGRRDRGFSRGREVFPFGKRGDSGARASAVLRNGNVVVAGFKERIKTGSDFAIAAFKGSGGCR